MQVAGGNVVQAFDNVAALLAAGNLDGATVKVTGELVGEFKNGTFASHVTDANNVISSSFGSSVVDSDWAVKIAENAVVRGAAESMDRLGFSAGLDIRRGTVELTGVVSAQPRMLLSPPAYRLTIDPTEVNVLPVVDDLAEEGGFLL